VILRHAIKPDSYLVCVDADELRCDKRTLPYPTCIGVVNVKRGTFNLWTPAALVPSGYRQAATRAMHDVIAFLGC